MSQTDASSTILGMTLGLTATGVFLPKLHEVDRESDVDDIRLGETVVSALLLATGAIVSYHQRTMSAFYATGVVAFVVVALYEYRIGGYRNG